MADKSASDRYIEEKFPDFDPSKPIDSPPPLTTEQKKEKRRTRRRICQRNRRAKKKEQQKLMSEQRNPETPLRLVGTDGRRPSSAVAKTGIDAIKQMSADIKQIVRDDQEQELNLAKIASSQKSRPKLGGSARKRKHASDDDDDVDDLSDDAKPAAVENYDDDEDDDASEVESGDEHTTNSAGFRMGQEVKWSKHVQKEVLRVNSKTYKVSFTCPWTDDYVEELVNKSTKKRSYKKGDLFNVQKKAWGVVTTLSEDEVGINLTLKHGKIETFVELHAKPEEWHEIEQLD